MKRTAHALRAWRSVAAAVAGACVAFSLATAGLALPALADGAPADKAPAEQGDRTADRTFIDDAGREHTVPGAEALEAVYYTSAISQIYSYTLAPDLACGTTIEFTEAELEYLPAEMADLPYLGTLSGGKELNPEAIIAAAPQLIVDITQGGITDGDISEADDLQAMTGIPVILLDGEVDTIDKLYTALGELFGREEEAAKLAEYCMTARSSVEEAVADIPEDERVTLYYAEGSEGLQTEPDTSPHALAFKIAGAKNVADVEANTGKGMSDVSLEQVLAWNPEVIITWSAEARGGADELIKSDPNWASIQAVQDGRVYTMPNAPFSWCDRPPSVNRFLGMQWVANILYPEAYDVDMLEVTKEFYSLFYHVDITDEQALELLGTSYVADEGAAEEKAAA